MKINKEQWVDNQYPEKWSDGVVLRTLNKIIDRKTDTRTTVTSVKEDPLKVSAPIITLQYRGNASEWFAGVQDFILHGNYPPGDILHGG